MKITKEAVWHNWYVSQLPGVDKMVTIMTDVYIKNRFNLPCRALFTLQAEAIAKRIKVECGIC